MNEHTAENVIARLLQALAEQVAASPGLAEAAAEALADLSRAESETVFGEAGLLVHYGADTEALEALIREITAVQRREVAQDAPLRPGDEVRLVGELPESLAGYDGTRLRETTFTVRYVSRAPTIAIQSDLAEDYLVATVPASAVERLPSRRRGPG
ncbi:hypothetical protein ACGFJ7_22985 [Actinoplanes sp. NPDC048988]|uniref:hypothetical protein n=1 Tax=Actinoplanes sp. NPDC048988 TaxID=3363901 RepID=UPI00371348D3